MTVKQIIQPALGIFLLIIVIAIFASFTNSNKKASSTTTQQCIITINGPRYDVRPLRGNHPGGNVFICGTDMTETFNQQHGMDYARLAPYKID